MSDEKKLIKMTVLPSVTVDTGYEGNEGQTFEDYKIKGNLVISHPFEPTSKNDRKLFIKIYAYAYMQEGWSGKIIEEVVLRKLEFEWEVDRRILEPEKLLASMIVGFLCDDICCKTFGYGNVFGSVGTFKPNVEFTFENELDLKVDYFNFLKFCHCFKKDFGKDDEEQHTNMKQSIRRYRIG